MAIKDGDVEGSDLGSGEVRAVGSKDLQVGNREGSATYESAGSFGSDWPAATDKATEARLSTGDIDDLPLVRSAPSKKKTAGFEGTRASQLGLDMRQSGLDMQTIDVEILGDDASSANTRDEVLSDFDWHNDEDRFRTLDGELAITDAVEIAGRVITVEEEKRGNDVQIQREDSIDIDDLSSLAESENEIDDLDFKSEEDARPSIMLPLQWNRGNVAASSLSSDSSTLCAV
jgi:hypothetical protein